MKKVERTRRARKRCACASPRTSNDAPVRSARPVVSDPMRHAQACCGAPSRRSGGRRGASRCGRARTRGGGKVRGAGAARKWVTSMRGVSNVQIGARICACRTAYRANACGRRLWIVLPFKPIRQSSSRRRNSMNRASLRRACPSVSHDCNRQQPPASPSRRAAQ